MDILNTKTHRCVVAECHYIYLVPETMEEPYPVVLGLTIRTHRTVLWHFRLLIQVVILWKISEIVCRCHARRLRDILFWRYHLRSVLADIHVTGLGMRRLISESVTQQETWNTDRPHYTTKPWRRNAPSRMFVPIAWFLNCYYVIRPYRDGNRNQCCLKVYFE